MSCLFSRRLQEIKKKSFTPNYSLDLKILGEHFTLLKCILLRDSVMNKLLKPYVWFCGF